MSEDATTQTAVAAPAQIEGIPQSLTIFNEQHANLILKLANQFSKSMLIPKHFQGKPSECFIILQLAQRMGEDPFMLMQNVYVVHGRPGLTAKLLIARANKSSVFSTRINWRTITDNGVKGMDWFKQVQGQGRQKQPKKQLHDLTIECYATLKETGEEISATASMEMACGEGWVDNVKYETMPRLMLQYRSATFLLNTYAPEIGMGMKTVEEIEDITLAVEVGPARPSKTGTERLPTMRDLPPEPEKGTDIDPEKPVDTQEEKPEPELKVPEDDNAEQRVELLKSAEDFNILDIDPSWDNEQIRAHIYEELDRRDQVKENTKDAQRENDRINGGRQEPLFA